MANTKLKKTILVTLTISVSSLINFSVLADGFIIALSVLVMGILIYCYLDLPGRMIAWLAAFFSPLFRLSAIVIKDGFTLGIAVKVLPDMAFFLMYGFIFGLISTNIIKGEWKKSKYSYFLTILTCDLCGNIFEMLIRSLIAKGLLISLETVALFALIAIIRTALVQVVIVAIESYTMFFLNRERSEMFNKLITQASVFEGELRLMDKNVNEIETVMRKAYDLHRSDDGNMTEETRRQILDIAKSAHEIKGDYMNVINTLKDVYVNELGNETLRLSEIIGLERQNLLATARTNGYTISVTLKIRTDYEVQNPFKLMSVIRNIFTNSIEAFQKKDGKIQVSLESDDENQNCILTIHDNGCGIDPENLVFVEMEGYSTKFNHETGNIQRGLGLSIVKDILENDYHGSLTIESVLNHGTTVTIIIPESELGERQ